MRISILDKNELYARSDVSIASQKLRTGQQPMNLQNIFGRLSQNDFLLWDWKCDVQSYKT
jgi:hypothetical protein